MSETRPVLKYGMTPAELDALVEWNRTRCHKRGCERRAEFIYAKWQRNAHGGINLFRYQRCSVHCILDPESIEPFA